MTEPLRDDELEALFQTARRPDPVPSEALMARVLADAAAEMPRRAAAAPRRGAGWSALWLALGGWTGASGLVAATAAGLWIGIAPPAGLDGLAASLTGAEALEVVLLPDTALFELEG
jgi:hypothetical protein